MPSSAWIVMPVLAHSAYTEAAISDCLAQTTTPHLLVINQGVDTEFRLRLEKIAEDQPRLFLWSHQPSLPSLAATWNRALAFCWEAGAEEALVVNNDVRLAPNTYELLSAEADREGALLVSGVGVAPKQFTPGQLLLRDETGGKGGPDFSCFLIDKQCHLLYPFDEHFIPAYCEDVDLHRRLLLDGRGHQIYSVNVPFLHHRSATLQSVDAKLRASIERSTAKHARAHYRRKWGGDVNEERYTEPFEPESAAADATTPRLQEDAWANASKT